jgi:multidrug resistance efflux pump
MKIFNPFYIGLFLTGGFLFVALQPGFHKELSFFGFAESRATEINYNHPVVVERILVSEGQEVRAGQVLMELARRKSRETLEDQRFRIAQLEAEEELWRQRLENDIEEVRISFQTRLAEIDRKIEQTQNEIAYNQSLVEGLQSIQPIDHPYNPLEDELASYQEEKSDLIRFFENKIKGLEEELDLGQNPYREQINRYLAEQQFEESQANIAIQVTAPADGLVGNISCKEGEHIPSYSTLITFYEPHSGVIVGYIHEDMTLEVEIGQAYTISSLKDETVSYPGTVIGLGSRIVEIPSRLRKVETVKVYGREVLIEISKDNSFLQKEKVSITYSMESNPNS